MGETPETPDTEEERREARKKWPVQAYALGSEPSEDLSATTTVDERLDMVDALSREAWALTGKPMPTYPRHETPIRVVSLGSVGD